jgi:hypothetical protein
MMLRSDLRYIDVTTELLQLISSFSRLPVLEAAVNGDADALVTFNRKHFANVPARFGIKLLLPSEALRRPL